MTTIEAASDAAVQFIFVNGVALGNKNPRPLAPNDRIIFGYNSAYVFRHDKSTVKPSTDQPVTAEFAANEKMDLQDKSGAA